MNDTKFEEAEKLFGRIEPTPTMTEYQRDQQRIRATYERLKAERLAREADQSLLPLSRLSSDWASLIHSAATLSHASLSSGLTAFSAWRRASSASLRNLSAPSDISSHLGMCDEDTRAKARIQPLALLNVFHS
jgi:hypothetical protein